MLKKLCVLSVMLCAVYIFSIFWRVSVSEAKFFGRSDLIPLSLTPPKYQKVGMPYVAEAFGSGVFYFDRDGKHRPVWRQKINGFQHIYGSALAAFELGGKPSDWLFCGNEYMEATADLILSRDGIGPEDLLDRRKDLYHNALGRQIAAETRALGLNGRRADRYMQRRILRFVDTGRIYIPHYDDPRVTRLKSEDEMGCHWLPPVISFYRR